MLRSRSDPGHGPFHRWTFTARDTAGVLGPPRYRWGFEALRDLLELSPEPGVRIPLTQMSQEQNDANH